MDNRRNWHATSKCKVTETLGCNHNAVLQNGPDFSLSKILADPQLNSLFYAMHRVSISIRFQRKLNIQSLYKKIFCCLTWLLTSIINVLCKRKGSRIDRGDKMSSNPVLLTASSKRFSSIQNCCIFIGGEERGERERERPLQYPFCFSLGFLF